MPKSNLSRFAVPAIFLNFPYLRSLEWDEVKRFNQLHIRDEDHGERSIIGQESLSEIERK